MLDFLSFRLVEKEDKRKKSENRETVVTVRPEFSIYSSKASAQDYMVRGNEFYAIWDEEKGIWCSNKIEAIRMIDKEIKAYTKQCKEENTDPMKVFAPALLQKTSNGAIDDFNKFLHSQAIDNYVALDQRVTYLSDKVSREDYVSKRLPYDPIDMPTPNYDRLMSTLYDPVERHKIEWAIGCVASNNVHYNQKFLVFYGEHGSGKSTVIDLIANMFKGYATPFDAKSLGSKGSQFATGAFETLPIVAYQHDGDLSGIDDNTTINQIVSHETMHINQKFVRPYVAQINAFLFMGTNTPVMITDAKSGMLRRLIDVTPSGRKLNRLEYDRTIDGLVHEYPGIAKRCIDVYLDDPRYYDAYEPVSMIGATNDFYNFIMENYDYFSKTETVVTKDVYAMYKSWAEQANVKKPLGKTGFKEELKSYYKKYDERVYTAKSTLYGVFSGFKTDKFDYSNAAVPEKPAEPDIPDWLKLDAAESTFDQMCAEDLAQYATPDETPRYGWANCFTKLKDIDTHQLHYVKPDIHHIVIDFDKKDTSGNKSLELNLKAASSWPPTYAEVSKGGAGLHLHYIYPGDPSMLSAIYEDNVEIKVWNGGMSLRRRLSKCNALTVATINSPLPLKGEQTVVNEEWLDSEKKLRTAIKRNLRKEYAPSTSQSISLIKADLDKAYEAGWHYDVSDLEPEVLIFAANSSNSTDRCMKMCKEMHFMSDDVSEDKGFKEEAPIIFLDIEVFPNLLLINWKFQGEDKKCTRMINPSPEEVEDLFKYRIIGFNNKGYDNHILWARSLGYNNKQIYELSKEIVTPKREQKFNVGFRESKNLSYTDVYDYTSNKQSLKKWEIELGITHMELGFDWNEPVPEEQWPRVSEYCDNDVISTEAVFNATQADFMCRKILAEVTGLTPNDSTNDLSKRFIFEGNKKPQGEFNYRDMGDVSQATEDFVITPELEFYSTEGFDEYTKFNAQGKPIFPGYKYAFGVSTYRGEEVGEGGYVYAEPGMYWNIALLDGASMHPSSLIAEELFGPRYTKRFAEIKDTRILIKHKEFDKAKQMLGGVLTKYLDDPATAKPLAQAMKIVINSVYGLTSASFPNECRDPRNLDNIVAKRGALFMVNLKHEVQKRGFTVAHIKTDSIKIPNATPEIIQFVMDYGKMYGYNFEHEATYERMCLVNNAVYIAKYDGTEEHEFELSTGEKIKTNWTATGTQFQLPHVFKSLFSGTELRFEDYCQLKSVKTAIYLDMNENLKSDEHNYMFVGKVGNFVPVVPGVGGGLLTRKQEDKYVSVTGSSKGSGKTKKTFRWMESDQVRLKHIEDSIDISYFEYDNQEAIEAIKKYGDFENFIHGDPPKIEPVFPYTTAENPDELPWYDKTPYDVA